MTSQSKVTEWERRTKDVSYRAAAQQARLAHVLSKADTILTGDRVNVKFVVPQAQYVFGRGFVAPQTSASWTDGENVSFNVDVLGIKSRTLTDQDIIYINGLNYHELSHILYGPKASSRYGKWVQRNTVYFNTWNILEDMRIERCMIAMYPSVRPFLHSVILKFVIEQSRGRNTMDTLHLLTYGRRYLPQDIRDGIRQQWGKPDILAEIETLIDEYLLLYFPSPKCEDRAQEIVKRVYELMNGALPPSPYGHDAANNNGLPEKGETDRASQKEALDWAEYEENEEKDEEDDSSDSGKSSSSKKNKPESSDDDGDDDDTDDADGQDGDSNDEEDQQGGSGASNDDDGEDDADDDSEDGSGGSGDSEDDEFDDSEFDDLDDDYDDSDDDGSDGGSSSDGDKGDEESDRDGGGIQGGTGNADPRAAKQALREKIMESIEAVAQDGDVAAEIKSKTDFMGQDDGGILALPVSEFTDCEVSGMSKLVSRRFGEELEVLRTDSDPGWNTYQPSGRINIQRAMMGGDIDVLFDQWDSDKMDATNITAGIAIDCSSSMRASIDMACEAGWAIKHAIEQIEGSVMMAAYNNTAASMYDAEDKADGNYYRAVMATGGTEVGACAKALRHALEARREKVKFLFVLTDGAFADENSAKEEFDAAVEHGIITVLVGFGEYASNYTEGYKENVSVIHNIKDIGQLVPLAKGIVTSVIASGVLS